jgi:hypothetical protein
MELIRCYGGLTSVIKFWIAAATVFAAVSGLARGAGRHCDRACMIALTDQYLAALVKHDPTGLPLSRGVRFTENTAEIRIGDGLWVGASEAPTTFKIYAVDPASNQVGFYGVMKENNRPLIIALRLKVVDGEITEIEHVLARNLRADRMQNLMTPRAALLADVPASERTSREDMINAANSYFEAIEHGDGEIAPFAEDCERHENGGQTTHNATPVPWPVPMGSPEADHAMAVLGTLTCTAQVNSQILKLHHAPVAAAPGTGGRTEGAGLRVSDVPASRRGAYHQDQGRAGRRYHRHERRDIEFTGRRDLQNPRWQNSRDRSDGNQPSVRN